jgi:cytochrome P450
VDVQTAVASLLTPDGRADPYPAYAVMHAHAPAFPAGDLFHVVVGYQAVDQMLRDPRLLVENPDLLDRFMPGWRDSVAVSSIARSMLRVNPPDHTRMRRLVSSAFTARRVAGLRETIVAQTDALADRMADTSGPVDFMEAFAYPLPVGVICALLGVPESDRDWFRPRATDLAATVEMQIGGGDLERADLAAIELAEYFRVLVDERRASPRDDLVSALVREQDGARLSGEELLSNLVLLLVAGFETTTNLLGNGLVALLDRVDLADRLRAEPERAPSYVEEMLRFDSPVQLTSRWAYEAVDVGGYHVPQYTQVLLLLGAANRDPARFTEPDRFDPDRPGTAGAAAAGRFGTASLAFGAGAHFCIGNALARLEAQVAFPRLIQRFPRLARAGEPVRSDRLTLRGYRHLPVLGG